MALCEEFEVVPRLLLDCTEITEASFLQMGKITESQTRRQNELSDTQVVLQVAESMDWVKNWEGNKTVMWKGSFMHVNAATDMLFNLLSTYTLIQ